MINRKNKFCVITTQRSGSTWLSTLLDSHPQIKAFEEPFTWRKYRPNWTDKNFPTYYDYKNNTSTKSPWVLFNYLDILDSYKAEKDFEIIGFKVMYHQILTNPELLIKLVLDRYKIVHLFRQNHLDILISRAALRQHNIVHSNLLSADQVQSKRKPVVLEPSSLIKELSRLDRNYKVMRTFLKLMPLPVLEMKYESLVENQEKILCSIANFLEVDSTSVTFNSKLKRVNPGVYEDKIANYDQVVKTLEGSKYANFLLI